MADLCTPSGMTSAQGAGAKTPLISPDENRATSHWTLVLGLLLAALWGASMAVVGLLVKLAEDMSPSLLVMYRFWCLLAVSVVGYWRAPDQWRALTARQWTLVWLRAVIGTVGQFCQLYSIRFLPLSDASAILLTTPALVTLLDILFFQLSCRLHHGLAIAATLCGVVLAARPAALFGPTSGQQLDSSLQLLGALLAAVGALCIAVPTLLLRSLADVPASTIYFSYSLLTICSSLLASGLTGQLRLPAGAGEIGITLGLTAVSCVLQMCMTHACRMAPVPLVTTLKTVLLLSLTLMLQDLVLLDTPAVTCIAGIVLIASAAVILAPAKWKPNGCTTGRESGGSEHKIEEQR